MHLTGRQAGDLGCFFGGRGFSEGLQISGQSELVENFCIDSSHLIHTVLYLSKNTTQANSFPKIDGPQCLPKNKEG